MPITPHEVRQSLLASDPEFRRLAEEHSRCESELETLLNESYLNSENLIQESVLKKMKLKLKDQMELLIANYEHEILQH
jgi:uncharacterized protein YdcH (DUF465 family)